MYIYKITNLINGKVYIGQTVKSLQRRFNRHINDALHGLDTHFAKAIRKYGKDNFEIKLLDDSAQTQEELNQLENYYIHKYNTLENGYNETDSLARSGGNTYAGRTKKQMMETRKKLSESKKGGKNPRATKVKCKNIKTGQELIFDSFTECTKYFQEKSHSFVSRRCTGKTKCAYKGEWIFAYLDNNYPTDCTKYKNNHRSVQIIVIPPDSEEKIFFPSYTAAEKEFDFPRNSLSKASLKKGFPFTYRDYVINRI